jgi:hypothetical protein
MMNGAVPRGKLAGARRGHGGGKAGACGGLRGRGRGARGRRGTRGARGRRGRSTGALGGQGSGKRGLTAPWVAANHPRPPSGSTAWAGIPGAIAQLGERRAGSAKVRGSIPLCSTEERPRRVSLRGRCRFWTSRCAQTVPKPRWLGGVCGGPRRGDFGGRGVLEDGAERRDRVVEGRRCEMHLALGGGRVGVSGERLKSTAAHSPGARKDPSRE